MDSLKIDADNNLVLIQGNLAIAVGIAACAQDTRTRIGLSKGKILTTPLPERTISVPSWEKWAASTIFANKSARELWITTR